MNLNGGDCIGGAHWCSPAWHLRLPGLRRSFHNGVAVQIKLSSLVREVHRVEFPKEAAVLTTTFSGHDCIGVVMMAVSFKLHKEFERNTARVPIAELNWHFINANPYIYDEDEADAPLQIRGMMTWFPKLWEFGDRENWVVSESMPRPLTRILYNPMGLSNPDSVITLFDYYCMLYTVSMNSKRYTYLTRNRCPLTVYHIFVARRPNI